MGLDNAEHVIQASPRDTRYNRALNTAFTVQGEDTSGIYRRGHGTHLKRSLEPKQGRHDKLGGQVPTLRRF